MSFLQVHGPEVFSNYHYAHKTSHGNANTTYKKALSNVRVNFDCDNKYSLRPTKEISRVAFIKRLCQTITRLLMLPGETI